LRCGIYPGDFSCPLAKPPFAGPEAVLAYFARYTHRVAIANSRLVSLDERGVTFRYKDYRRNGRARFRTMTLKPNEFIRRFLLHVLPNGFHRIRHYGLLASATCKANIARARELIATPLPSIDPSTEQDDPDVTVDAGADYRPPCPCCGGRMIIVESFGPGRRTSRPALAASRGRDCNAMTPITASSQLPPTGEPSPPALHRCRPAVSEATSYTFDQAKIARSTAAETTILALPSSIRRQLRRPAHPLPKPPSRQIPIAATAHTVPRRFLPGGLSDAGPQCARIDHHGPASETLHRIGRCRRQDFRECP
jgi:hypothetical protein